MELWIRSQDKERLIKVNNILIRNFEDGSCGIQINSDCFVGEYKSQKRAEKVLNEIHNILYKVSCPDLKNITDVSKLYIPPIIVYEMPKE